ncbi:alpha/beta hydrolase [Actinoplanes sp. CA-030573]|uniref:alpha/beta hydrolase n=1 Tax=Actinoplanes sp. CA-030573 TaxID=3239898 RepID=UPI003D94C107
MTMTTIAGTVPPPAPPRRPSRTGRVVRAPLGLAGSVAAVLFSCASLTPSLLPRAWYLQGIVSGLTAAIGYGVGAGLGALVRLVWRRTYPRATRIAWRVLLIAAPIAGLLMLALGTKWQQELRARLDMERMATYDIVRIVAVGALTFAALLLIARLLRLGARLLARLLGRWVPRPIAYAAGFTVVAYLSIGFVNGFLLDNLLTVADRTASLTNGGTPEGVHMPGSALRSGSPASAAPWRTLGRQGREFVGTGPTVAQLTAFAGRPAREPIRLYAGLDSAASAGARARLVVQEMDRTGAFDRAVVGVVTPTGTGWVDRNVTDSLEYMYGGDTALVSMQYSYLPSWISFLADRSKVSESAAALIGAVHARWAAMPAANRPELLLFGESLGSFGTETAFADPAGLTSGADGVLLVGPPFANPIRQSLVAGRDAGSPVWNPAFSASYPARAVEFARQPADLRTRRGTPPAVVYLQNSSDPIVWWTPALLFERPQWLDDPRGPDVSPDMHWYPLVTFWQTAVDQVIAIDVPAGHGHVYGSGVADGWAALAAPPGWTTNDTVRLRALLDAPR